MSSARVKTIKQFFPIRSYSYDSSTGVATITANNHNLFTGVDVYITSDNNYYAHKTTANVTSANVFTISTTASLQNVTNFAVDGYLGGPNGNAQIGTKEAQTLPRATGTETIIQSYVNGTGGAAFAVDVSLDASHWITAANVSHTTVSQDTAFVTIAPGWAYYRVNCTAIGSNTNLVIMSGE